MKSSKAIYIGVMITAAAWAQREPEKPPLILDLRLPGWADLHAHPASHLAFGADANGKGGIFWGYPSLNYEAARGTIEQDLPRCNFKHSGYDDDVVRHETRKALMQQLDSVTEYPHVTADFGDNNFGSPDFKHWPHPRLLPVF